MTSWCGEGQLTFIFYLDTLDKDLLHHVTYKKNALVLIYHSADGAQSQRGTERLRVDTTVLLDFYGNTIT